MLLPCSYSTPPYQKMEEGFTNYCMLSGISAHGPQSFLDEDEGKIHTLSSKLAKHLTTLNSKDRTFPSQDEVKSALIEARGRSNPLKIRLPDLRFAVYHGAGTFHTANGQWVNITNQPLAFMDSRCWHYLVSWLDLEISAPLHEELWSVIAPKKNGDFVELAGQYPTYLLQNYKLDNVIRDICLKGLPSLSWSLSQGLRGEALGPALLDDFQTWVFESPDLWPLWTPEIESHTFHSFASGPSKKTRSIEFISLPLELSLDILTPLSLIDVLNLSSTCKAMRHHITRDEFLPLLLHDMILYGSLRWLKPCRLVVNEVQSANRALATWIPGGARRQDPFQDPQFPFLDFVWHCHVECYLMMNRKRLWYTAKVLEEWIVIHRLERKAEEDLIANVKQICEESENLKEQSLHE
ncbi:hypothetical protein DL96DRAFT_1705552 [Flagelloscypha sp. PMI_526]|nr:hypothetical protein DL96DRAFT_1705552 [Flagelloscypha sp. PMI_526]